MMSLVQRIVRSSTKMLLFRVHRPYTVLASTSVYPKHSSFLMGAAINIYRRNSHSNPLGLPQTSPHKSIISDQEKLNRARKQFALKDASAPKQAGPPVKRAIPNVKYIIVVASGKGGVGKSTTTVNLAVGLRSLGHRVGILDADLFGPSIPILMGLKDAGRPLVHPETGLLIPLENYGLKCMSIGFLVPPNSAVVWRGLMVMKALEQLLRQVSWGELDILLIDMPPGTGDTQLTISQQLPLDGAVIVSTPQDLSLADARKGIDMFQQVKVPILGLVQNMSIHICPKCSHESHIFGDNGVDKVAQAMHVPLLASVPLHSAVCQMSDQGNPIANHDPRFAQIYRTMAEEIMKQLL